MPRSVPRILGGLMLATFGAAVVAKSLLRSNAAESTQEVDIVSILGGTHLVSSASPFYGGRVLALFANTLLDLRRVTPAPTGVYLDMAVLMGGVRLVIPPGWRVRSEARVITAGYHDGTGGTADPDAPLLHISGRVVGGGLRVTTSSPVEAVT